jgi:pimeloyl-ACP methyl ester carboxylesterase
MNSTNVRLSILRGLFRLLGRLSPRLGGAVAERLFFAPPRPRRAPSQRALAGGRRFQVRVGRRRIAAWLWGHGPTVVLLHGWGGRAAQLTSFVTPLLDRGYSVVAFDAPGHGVSGGRLSSAPEFAAALRAVADRVGGAHAVVAHSLGAAAVVLALRRGLSCERLVFLGPAADPPAWIEPFARRLGVSPRIQKQLRTRSERRIGVRWEELAIPPQAADFDLPLLVIHDRDDAEVPWTDGSTIAASWPGARLVTTSGLGHYRLLRDPEAIARAVSFLAEGNPKLCPSCGSGAASGLCAGCVERDLFERDRRWDTLATRWPNDRRQQAHPAEIQAGPL